ncbi:adenosine kinase [Maribellus sp. YY47]|uniref:adenosine kinase n=1 Tax=Maribellus sp. YY47 TaxID=2929486 RepID=UPI002000B69A|nr:adenosine kinase [Maribellus sp. YY47]MCK3684276.1 adenosine kinase [Maribellus sp. YY47]
MIDKNIPAVLGVGNALVDVISVINDDSLLEKFGLPRGSMTLVDAERSQQIYAATFSESSTLTTGGSVANTMRSFANLGGNGGYMGKVGKDKLGDLFKEDFEKRGLRTHLSYSENGTGRVMGLVSRDSERTMATYLGAASELQPYDFTPGLFKGYKYLYMEGYLVFNHELIKAGVEKAKAAGLKIAIDLSSFNVVDANLEFLKDLVKNNVDIVIANEEEARSFTGLEPEAALHEIAKYCELAIVKVGKEGSMIKHGDEVTRIGIVPAKAVDTTGAGDAYAAGFFYGLTKGYPMNVSGKIAALVSGKVVEVMGPNLPDAQWPEVMAEINKIVAEE